MKIGQSRNVHVRLIALLAMHHEDIFLLGTIPEEIMTEKFLHEYFDNHRVRGEWFHPSPELLELAAASLEIWSDGFVKLDIDSQGEAGALLWGYSKANQFKQSGLPGWDGKASLYRPAKLA